MKKLQIKDIRRLLVPGVLGLEQSLSEHYRGTSLETIVDENAVWVVLRREVARVKVFDGNTDMESNDWKDRFEPSICSLYDVLEDKR